MSELNLTLKQRKWLKLYMETGNATESAMQTYDCKDRESASALGSENLGKLRDLTMPQLMEESGLDDASLLNILKENLKATKLFGKEAIEFEDYATRNKALEIALKVKGKLTNQVDLTSKGEKIQASAVEIAQNLKEIIEDDKEAD